jgi:3-hydroxymyristoyl/3-hydroxydecanoyl-(acyl carrier protein) dehydratase
MDVRIAKRRSKLIKFECEAWVGGSKVTEAEITVSLY